MPKVSIIIPTYNRANLIEKTIKSVISQTIKDWELLIVDDGSTDDTLKVIKPYLKDNRIKYFFQKNSGGPAGPRNIGIKNSNGKYIAFLDSDDEWFPEKLEKQISLFKKTDIQNVGFVGCNVTIIKDGKYKNKTNEFKIPYKGKIFDIILNGNFILSCSNIIVRKKILDEVGGFDTQLKYLDDWDMWLRITKNGYNFDYIDYPLFNYYIHTDNITKKISDIKKLLEGEYILNKYYEFKKNQNKLLKIGLQFLILGNKEKFNEYIKKSLIINPENKLIKNIYLFSKINNADILLKNIILILIYIRNKFRRFKVY